MCNRYRQAPREKISTYGLLTVPTPFPSGDVFPRGNGSFIRPGASGGRELVAGQWGLVPHFAKSRILTYSTNNARFEGVKTAASYKLPWTKGQRCIIPAEVFWEPCWESGKNEWWAFRRADGHSWSLAGLWATWVDRETGEVVESYTMLTQNADHHPLMRRMHKPDPKLGSDQQDKRSVVVLEKSDLDAWLNGSPEEAERLIRLTPAEAFDARPDRPEAQPR
jgi:putative SOS response-associated peptidase YedK